MVLFTSDNGYYYGEHGLTIERRLPYEETLKTPLLVRYPGTVNAGSEPAGLTLSIDLAATILDIAGAGPKASVQGRSLMPMLSGKAEAVREAAYMEYYSHENPFVWGANLDYRVIRKGNYKYIRWMRFEDAVELYDLQVDPYEIHNLIDQPKHSGLIRELENDLRRELLAASGLQGD
jgi:N-acetylglucosamine-6-sulfatase